jgi:uncharacterized membrane protein
VAASAAVGVVLAVVALRGNGEMNMNRIVRHLWTGDRTVRRSLPDAAFDRIQRAVQAAEQRTQGQIRIVVEDSLPLGPLLRDRSPHERAIEVFTQLRVWDTHSNCGVLIYLLFADRAVEIVADRGVHAHVGSGVWTAICSDMENSFKSGQFERGLVDGVETIGRILADHFPSTGRYTNELPDRPQII